MVSRCVGGVLLSGSGDEGGGGGGGEQVEFCYQGRAMRAVVVVVSRCVGGALLSGSGDEGGGGGEQVCRWSIVIRVRR